MTKPTGPTVGGGLNEPPSGGREMVINPERARLLFDFKTVFALTAAILGGGLFAGQKLQELTYRLGSMEQRLDNVPTKAEIVGLRNEITASIRQRVSTSIVRCPSSVLRNANVWVDCRIVLTGE